MMPVMEEVAREFRARTGAELVLTQGSSGKFVAQIAGGAPFDAFVSADMERPAALAARGLSDGPPERYARGSLILWSLSGADVSSLEALRSPRTRKIAIADPRLAPYGRAAVEALKKAGVYEAVEGRLVYGESLSQVNQFTASRAADAGITSRSIVETERWRGRGAWTAVDPALHAPLDQGFVVTKRGAARAPELARAFREVLLGAKGRAILEKYGYAVPKHAAARE